MNQNQTLSGSLQILAPMIGEKMGVKVVFGSKGAMTDGQTIFLPDLPPDHAEAPILGFGYLLHEAFHIKESDFTLQYESDLHKKLCGILEDIRIEAKGSQRYPGAKKDLSKLVGLLVAKGRMQAVDENTHPGGVVSGYMLYRLRHDVLGQPCGELADSAEKHLKHQFPQGAVTRLDGLMYQVTNCETEADVVILAKSILRMLQEEQEKAKEEKQQSTQQQPQPQNADDGSAKTSQADGQSQDNQSKPQGSQRSDGGQSDSQQPSSGKDAGQDDVSGNQPATSQGGDDASGQAEALAKALSASASDLDQDMGQMVAEMLNQQAQQATRDETLRAPTEAPATKGKGDQSKIASVRRETNALRQRLAGLMQARTLAQRHSATSGRRIDRKSICRVVSGDSRIFTKQIDGIKTDTAIMVLVDMSYSMKGDPATVAMESGLATAVAMDNIPGVSVSAAWFNSMVGCLTDFGEKPDKTSTRYNPAMASGGTNLASALLWGARRLLSQKQPRKIMMILSDGKPDQDTLCAKMLRMLEREGVETIGIGIMDYAILGLMKNATVINNLGDLPKAMVSLLQDALLKKAA